MLTWIPAAFLMNTLNTIMSTTGVSSAHANVTNHASTVANPMGNARKTFLQLARRGLEPFIQQADPESALDRDLLLQHVRRVQLHLGMSTH